LPAQNVQAQALARRQSFSRTPSHAACSATSNAMIDNRSIVVGRRVSVLRSVFVAILAVGGLGLLGSPPVVFLKGDNLHVTGVDTGSYPTQVIQVHPDWYRTMYERVGEPVRNLQPYGIESPRHRVPFLIGLWPKPATIEVRKCKFLDSSKVPDDPFSWTLFDPLYVCSFFSRGSETVYTHLDSFSSVSEVLSNAPFTSSVARACFLVGDNCCVFRRVMMASFANRTEHKCSAFDIFLNGHRLKMPRIATTFIFTQVVNVQRRIEWSNKILIRESVKFLQPPLDRYLSRVAIPVNRSGLPAAAGPYSGPAQYLLFTPDSGFPLFHLSSISQQV